MFYPDSGKPNASNPLLCGLCHALLFEPVSLHPCTCLYCADCVPQLIAPECLTCGIDLDTPRTSTPNEMAEQNLVLFIKAHLESLTSADRAAQFLAYALNAHVAGNPYAADVRYAQAQQAFGQALEEIGKNISMKDATESQEIKSNTLNSLAICLAKHADVRATALHDPESARDFYKGAVKCFRDAGSTHTHNDLAILLTKYAAFETEFLEVNKVIDLYREALASRKQAFDSGSCSSVEYAASLTTLASALVRNQQPADSAEQKEEAQLLLQQAAALVADDSDERALRVKKAIAQTRNFPTNTTVS